MVTVDAGGAKLGNFRLVRVVPSVDDGHEGGEDGHRPQEGEDEEGAAGRHEGLVPGRWAIRLDLYCLLFDKNLVSKHNSIIPVLGCETRA